MTFPYYSNRVFIIDRVLLIGLIVLLQAEALEAQVKELTVELNNTERSKKALESEFQNAVKKIWSLREVIQDLEVQLAEISERESSLKKKVEKLNTSIEEQTKINANLKDEVSIVFIWNSL